MAIIISIIIGGIMGYCVAVFRYSKIIKELESYHYLMLKRIKDAFPERAREISMMVKTDYGDRK